MKKSIRLVVIGDQGVGKSTLISTIYSQLQANVQRTLRRVILPPEMCLYSKQIFTEIIDTSVEMDLKTQVNEADLVMLVYDISDPETIANISSVWLPKVTGIRANVPVLLVGNKIDIKQHEFESENQYVKVKDILKKVTKQYKNVQMGIQCSAFYDRNVRAVLNCAQRAVLYPLSPLYNLQSKQITKNFHKALIRIFRILDKDMDGKLYDQELNSLQERVFQSQLNLEDIKAIKQIIIRQLKVDYHDYIQLDGFMALQKKCIDMLKIQICWSILRYFHYNDNLLIIVSKNDYFRIQQSESIELSGDTIDFLLKLYNFVKTNKPKQHEQEDEIPDQSNYMMKNRNNSNNLVEQIFASSPWIRLPQFQLYESSHNEKDMSQEKFIVNWSLYALIDYQKCYEDLLYLGYEKTIDETFIKKSNKKTYKNYQKLKENKVFSILIIESSQHSIFIDSLFQDGQTIFMDNGNKYMRNAYLHTVSELSRVFILFKVNENDLEAFFQSNPQTKSFASRIDIIINWETNKSSTRFDRNKLPSTILYRVILQSQAESKLHTSEPLKLNLDNFPVQYRNSNPNTLFELVLNTCQHFDRYLSKQTINKLKIEQEKKNKIIGLSAVAICGIAIIGTILFKNGSMGRLLPK